MHNRALAFATLLLLGILLGGCRRSNQQPVTDLNFNLATVPYPPVVGPARLLVEVTDETGASVGDVVLAVKGDMTHAGMAPVLAESTGAVAGGSYEIPFEWTMAGDWVVTVEAQRGDLFLDRERFEFTVGTLEGELCTADDS